MSGNSAASCCDRIERLEAEPAVVLVAGADREGQRIDQQIVARQAVAVAGELDQAARDLELARGVLGHAGLVDGQRDHRAPNFCASSSRLAAGLLAVLEVDRVDDRPCRRRARAPPRAPAARSNRTPAGASTAPRSRLTTVGHVGDLVAADIGGADVERVRALLGLLAADRDAAVPVVGRLALAELPWSRWRCSARRSRDRRSPGAAAPRCRARRAAPGVSTRRGFGRGRSPSSASRRSMASSAAMCSTVVPQQPPTIADAVLGDEALEPARELLGPERVVGLAVDQLGQAGVRQHRDRARPVLGKMRQMLGHLLRPGRAVEAR